MAEFDHVELGASPASMQGYAIQPGTRHMREAPYFVDRFSTGEQSHRGDAFWQHWVMAGWRGGIGQDLFHDVEMVHESVGLDGSSEGKLVPWFGWEQMLAPQNDNTYAYKSTRYARRAQWRLRGFSQGADESSVYVDDSNRCFFVYDESGTTASQALVRHYDWVYENSQWKFNTPWAYGQSSDSTNFNWLTANWETVKTQAKLPSNAQRDDYRGFTCGTYFRPKKDGLKGYNVFGDRWGDIYFFNHDTSGTSQWRRLFYTPLRAGQAITAMCVFNGKLYVAQNNAIYAWDGMWTNTSSVTDLKGWTTTPVAETEVHLTCATVWNGAMWWGGYQSYHGKLYRIDAAGAIEVASLNDNFNIMSLCPYAGSLFIGGASYDQGKVRHIGRLYRFNGSSLTEMDLGKMGVHRAPDLLQGIWDMEVWNGKLVIPAADFAGVLFYDAAEDAISRSARCWSDGVVDPTDGMATSLVIFHGNLYCYIPRYGLFAYTPGKLAPSSAALSYYMDTSVFDAGLPLVDKLWWDFEFDWEKMPANALVDVFYRQNETDAWTSLGTITPSSRHLDFPNRGLLSKRLQLRFDFDFGAGHQPGVIRGFYVRYVVEPRVRRNWSMTLLAVDRIERNDGSMEPNTGLQLRDLLWDARADRKPLYFRDVDGSEYTVVVANVSEYQHNVNTEDGLEVVMAVQLWEA